MLLLAVKAFALFFLLQAVSVFFAAFVAERTLPRLDARLRARFTSASLLLAFLLPLVFACAVAALAYARVLYMETAYFHALMHGGWEKSILFAGTLGFGLSVMSSFLFVKFGSLPVKPGGAYKEFRGLKVFESAKLYGAALLGAFNPIIVLGNASTDDDSRRILLVHEHSHFELRHNLMKLFIRALLRLNMFNLPLHRIARRFDALCEFEADAHAAAQIGAAEYSAYLASLGDAARAESGGAEAVEERIAILTASNSAEPVHRKCASMGISVAVAAVVASIPLAALSFLTLPRCAMVCFLGY